MNEEKTSTDRKRGVGFPSINLIEAVSTMSRASSGGYQSSKESFAKAIGYSTVKNGAFLVKIATLRSYGLVDKGEMVRFTQLAKELILPGGDESATYKARQQAFFNVDTFSQLYKRLSEGPGKTDIPSIARVAILDLGISHSRGDEFAKNFIDSGKYAGVLTEDESGKITLSPNESTSQQNTEAHVSTHTQSTQPSFIPNEQNSQLGSTRDYTFSDRSVDWELNVSSKAPISAEIKRILIDAIVKIDEMNRKDIG